MTIPEWAVVLLVGGIGAVIWWGVKRLVKANDDMATSLGQMSTQLSLVNGRLGKSETWMAMHSEQNEQGFSRIEEAHKELWHAINANRG